MAINEEMRRRRQQTFGSGYDNTYLFPGLRKVIHATGRLIRTTTDTSTIYLIDDHLKITRDLSLTRLFDMTRIVIFVLTLALTGCTQEPTPHRDEELSAGGVTAEISYRWVGVDGIAENMDATFTAGTFSKLTKNFFVRELDVSFQPNTGSVMVFPHKNMLITSFSTVDDSSGHGGIIVGIAKKNGKPRIFPLAGCFVGDTHIRDVTGVTLTLML